MKLEVRQNVNCMDSSLIMMVTWRMLNWAILNLHYCHIPETDTVYHVINHWHMTEMIASDVTDADQEFSRCEMVTITRCVATETQGSERVTFSLMSHFLRQICSCCTELHCVLWLISQHWLFHIRPLDFYKELEHSGVQEKIHKHTSFHRSSSSEELQAKSFCILLLCVREKEKKKALLIFPGSKTNRMVSLVPGRSMCLLLPVNDVRGQGLVLCMECGIFGQCQHEILLLDKTSGS